jgi:tRNA (pseudouridine54-N1)-methyltransferase
MITSRQFVISSHAVTSPDNINLKDLPGSAGRLDVVARCVNAALWLSYGIRRDVTFHAVLSGPPHPPVHLRFDGSLLKRVSPDERSIALFIKKALTRVTDGTEVQSTPGIFVGRRSFKEVVQTVQSGEMYLLNEEGAPVTDVAFGDSPVFFLGDNRDLSAEECAVLRSHGARPLSLGSRSYVASHCIAVLNYLVDVRDTLPRSASI